MPLGKKSLKKQVNLTQMKIESNSALTIVTHYNRPAKVIHKRTVESVDKSKEGKREGRYA